MSYSTINEMRQSMSLIARITAAAAQEGVTNPDQWARDQIWAFAANTEWADAWAYAKETETLDHNPDTGARPGVINDAMILSAVQAQKAATGQ